MRLGLVVEGHGEVLAVPTLVTRVLQESLARYGVVLHDPPLRVKRGKFAPRFDEYEKALRLLAGTNDAVLVILDSDDDDPIVLREGLEARARVCIAHRPVRVAPAVKEFEAWFLASIGSLAGKLEVDVHASHVGDPDVPRGAKGIFENLLVDGRYSETVDQKKYSAVLDIEMAKANSGSFRALVQSIDELTRPEP